jgi:hypothetical protein
MSKTSETLVEILKTDHDIKEDTDTKICSIIFRKKEGFCQRQVNGLKTPNCIKHRSYPLNFHIIQNYIKSEKTKICGIINKEGFCQNCGFHQKSEEPEKICGIIFSGLRGEFCQNNSKNCKYHKHYQKICCSNLILILKIINNIKQNLCYIYLHHTYMLVYILVY